jgi:L,D-peptidoglycan transpeptidase YkuD (ErfK/YbiS/YcfS/YnhG family)
MRKLLQKVGVGLGVAALVATGIVLSLNADAAAVPPYFPTKLRNVGDAKQLIVVTGVSKKSTYATARTYQLGADGVWTAKFPAMAARIGYNGWVPYLKRVQDTGTTPKGTFRITDAFGLKANPGTKIRYRHVDANDYWVGDQKDPKTYNMWQGSASKHRTWRKGQAELLSSYPVQYEYAAVVDFNRPQPATIKWNATYSEYVTSKPSAVKRGSAIFLHINGKGSTGGCVSLKRADLLSVLKWLDPARHPRIIMAPLSEIGTA